MSGPGTGFSFYLQIDQLKSICFPNSDSCVRECSCFPEKLNFLLAVKQSPVASHPEVLFICSFRTMPVPRDWPKQSPKLQLENCSEALLSSDLTSPFRSATSHLLRLQACVSFPFAFPHPAPQTKTNALSPETARRTAAARLKSTQGYSTGEKGQPASPHSLVFLARR